MKSWGVSSLSAGAQGLENVAAYWTAFDLGTNLSEAMKTRPSSTGQMLIRRRSGGVCPSMLRAAVQRENVKLRQTRAGSSSGAHRRVERRWGQA